jgi:hypothetical protein
VTPAIRQRVRQSSHLDSLPASEAAWPAMSHADTLGNMRVLDAWQAALRGAAAFS